MKKIIYLLIILLIISISINISIFKELKFSKESNDFKRELIYTYDSTIMVTDHFLNSMEENHILPEEDERLDSIYYFFNKIDSIYNTEL